MATSIVLSSMDHLPADAARRFNSRLMRKLTREEPPKTTEEVCQEFCVSRATFFNRMKELDVWERKAGFEGEARELASLSRSNTYHPMLWALASDRLIMTYAQGNLDSAIEQIITRRAPARDDIGTETIDPLCD